MPQPVVSASYQVRTCEAILERYGSSLRTASGSCNRTSRPGEHLLKPIRQLIESVHDTVKGQLDLELHGARSTDGVAARVAQRLLALTAAIWHNRATSQPLTRSLIAYDH
jgi:hypothetical protein